MKPTFALDLTSEAIGLLHRTPKGWLSIGETAFDAPDLTEALDGQGDTAAAAQQVRALMFVARFRDDMARRLSALDR